MANDGARVSDSDKFKLVGTASSSPRRPARAAPTSACPTSLPSWKHPPPCQPRTGCPSLPPTWARCRAASPPRASYTEHRRRARWCRRSAPLPDCLPDCLPDWLRCPEKATPHAYASSLRPTPQVYVIQALHALHTAGWGDAARSGPQIALINSTWWDKFITGYLSMIVPSPFMPSGANAYMGQTWQASGEFASRTRVPARVAACDAEQWTSYQRPGPVPPTPLTRPPPPNAQMHNWGDSLRLYIDPPQFDTVSTSREMVLLHVAHHAACFSSDGPFLLHVSTSPWCPAPFPLAQFGMLGWWDRNTGNPRYASSAWIATNVLLGGPALLYSRAVNIWRESCNEPPRRCAPRAPLAARAAHNKPSIVLTTPSLAQPTATRVRASYTFCFSTPRTTRRRCRTQGSRLRRCRSPLWTRRGARSRPARPSQTQAPHISLTSARGRTCAGRRAWARALPSTPCMHRLARFSSHLSSGTANDVACSSRRNPIHRSTTSWPTADSSSFGATALGSARHVSPLAERGSLR